MYSLWCIYKEKLSYLVNQIYLLLQKQNLTLVLQIINTEKPFQSFWQVAQSLTGVQLKVLFKRHKSLFSNNEKKRKYRIFFFFGSFITM